MTNNKYLRKELLFLSFSSLLALFFLGSCQKQPALLFGDTYLGANSSANIVLVDSSTIQMSTILVDSTSSASTNYLMVGSYNDDWLGRVTSRAFWRVGIPSAIPTLDPRVDTYDSIGLVVFARSGNPYYGDTTAYQTYQVNQIDTIFDLANGQNGWSSKDSLPLGPVLGSASVRIFPNLVTTNYLSNTSQGSGDTVRIPMDHDFGAQLYNMAYNKSDTLTNTTIWQRWFHGLCLSPGGSSTANLIYGFEADTVDKVVMRIYYRENGVTSTSKSIDFPLTDKSFQFNNIHNDYTGKPINNLIRPTQNPQVPPATLSSQIGHAGYVQTVGGLNVKLTFPYLSSIALRNDYIGLLRATLIVRPVPGSFTTTWRPPPAVGIYYTDQNNLLGIPIPALGLAGAQTGALNLDYFHPLNTVYTYDVTSFVKSQIINTSPIAYQSGVILSIPPPANTGAFNRLIIADQTYPIDQRITLNVYYISLFPHQ
jgi:hypothetical protein